MSELGDKKTLFERFIMSRMIDIGVFACVALLIALGTLELI